MNRTESAVLATARPGAGAAPSTARRAKTVACNALALVVVLVLWELGA